MAKPKGSPGKGRTRRTHTPPLRQLGPRPLRATQQANDQRPAPFPDPPAGWTGTRPEWAINWAHLRLGKRPGVDFEYQGGFAGGHQILGGAVVDFLEYNPPNLAINVNGIYWHYHRGSAALGRDRFQRAQLAQYGVTLIFIDEPDALSNPVYFLQEAWRGLDHSRLGPGRA